MTVTQDEGRGKNKEIGGDAEDHAAACDDAEFRKSAEIIETQRKESGGSCAASGDDGDAGVLQGFPHRLIDAAASAELLLVTAKNLDAEVDPNAEDHRNDGDGKDIKV